MKKFWKKTEGFTLVELVVVIAILGILAGIGTVGYSGYVKKANLAADQQLVSSVKNALELQYYAEPGFTGVAAVVLDDEGAKSSGDTDSAEDTGFVDAAMDAAFGEAWRDTLSLKHNGWGKGAAMAKNVVDYFTGVTDADLASVFNGTTKPSFAADVDELFVTVEETARLIGNITEGTGAGLVAGAADLTLAISGADGKTNTQTFADAWDTPRWDNSILMAGYGDYGADAGDLSEAALHAAIANAAVLKARNTALAGYLRDAGYGEVYDIFANYNFVDDSGNKTMVPMDIVAVLRDTPLEYRDAYMELDEELYEILGSDDDRINELYADIDAYFNNGTARKDGLAYFAMMSTVDAVEDDVDTTDDSTYWNDLAGAVSMYGSIATGNTTLDELDQMYANLGSIGDDCVAVTIMADNGSMVLNINPRSLMGE